MAAATARLCCCLSSPPPQTVECAAARLASTQRAGAPFAAAMPAPLSSLWSANSASSLANVGQRVLAGEQRFPPTCALSNVGPVVPGRTYYREGDGGRSNRMVAEEDQANGGQTPLLQQERGPFPRPPVIRWERDSANAVRLMGRVGRDIEITYLDSGKVVATTSLAVSKGSHRTEDPNWFTLEIFDNLAEIAAQHVAKGELILVTGNIVGDTRVKDGVRSTNVKVVVRDFCFVEPSSDRRQPDGKSNDEFTVRGSCSVSQAEAASMDSSQRNWNRQQLSSQTSQGAFAGFQGARVHGNDVALLEAQSPQAENSGRQDLKTEEVLSGAPASMKAGLNVIAQGRLQSRSSYGSRVWSRDTPQGNGSTQTLRAGSASEATAVLQNRLQRGIKTDSKTYVNALQICLKQKDLFAAKQVHECIIQSGIDRNLYLARNLLNVYLKCGALVDARQVFDLLEKKSVVDWTLMMEGYAKSDHAESALELFNQMRQEGVKPDAITYMSILKACTSLSAPKWGKEIHECIRLAGFESDVFIGTALLKMYAKCGCIAEARLLFETLTNRDVMTWTVMIGGLAQHGFGHEAYRLFLQMRREGFEPNAVTYVSLLNASASAGALEWVKEVHRHVSKAGLESDLRVGSALVRMYAEIGSIDDARRVFEKLTSRDVITWTVMIGGLAQHGFGHEAYRLFLQMRREGFEPNAITYVSILNPSASAGALEWVREVHRHASKAGLESDLRLGNALIHMYAESGSIDDARQVFDRVEKGDVVTWNAMIGGLAYHGYGHEALALFRKMNAELVKPNGTTFVAVLSACCHGGLVDDGRRLFSAMTQEYGIEPDIVHYTCMVDLLGRAGHLEEAKRFMSGMPVEPDVVIWTALLGACRTHGNVELGEVAANELFKLEPSRASTYVLLSNIYAAAGKWEKVASVRNMMQQRGVRKDPGRSWIEVDNKIHEFVVGDESHPEAKAIYTELTKLTEKLKAEGYIPDTRVVLHDINEEDKELALCSHSEKLAIAYGLIHIPRGEPIRIEKNLRVCPDCHTATKLISKVTGREIIARDASRFHHFKDGACSCGDYW